MRGFSVRLRKWILASAAGGTMFVLSGCDTTVRDTVLNGVESASTVLATGFLQAFFESLTAVDETVPTTVKVIAENAPNIFA